MANAGVLGLRPPDITKEVATVLAYQRLARQIEDRYIASKASFAWG